MALSKLPGCFGLQELKKGYFPHLFNTKANQHYVGPLPNAHFYSPDTMSSAAREAFLKWHAEHENDVFDFQKEMLEYCKSDVDILKRCCLEFRQQFMDITEVDPFSYVTIASACMAVYRSCHIKDRTIAMVPVRGYVNSTASSESAIWWLDFVAETEGLTIQHAMNGLGEKKIKGRSVDGFCEATNTIYLYHGCFYHGCATCYTGDAINSLNGVRMKELLQKTTEKTEFFKSHGYQVVENWDHEFLKAQSTHPGLREFVRKHELSGRLKPRDAFFGGRTDAIQLYYEGACKYVDFTSLYPWVNKYCAYPVGHPEIITEGFGSLEDYFGIVKCRVLPPRGLYLPVLPFRCNGKLMFPLCRTCAETKQEEKCVHSDEERALVGTWVTEEVKMALKKGYQIERMYEVYHFAQSSCSLFGSYIDLFLKIKQESSGWPTECSTLSQKEAYIQQYWEREGVYLDAEQIQKNPGRRQVAKLALNSFWGRWGMNCNKSKINYVNTLEEFNKFLGDSKKLVKDVYFPNPNVAALVWENEGDFLPQDTSTNIFLAVFTTAWARLKLYEEMDKLGESVLYHDTDSIIYATNGRNDPTLGNFLGEFTDELDGDTIQTFVSGGAKNYAYVTAAGKTCCKVRGFTLNFQNAAKLNFDSVKALVYEKNPEETISICNERKITRDAKQRKVVNKEEKKRYRIVYDKRVICDNFKTLPYGY